MSRNILTVPLQPLARLLVLLACACLADAKAQSASSPSRIASPDGAGNQSRVLVLYSARQGQPAFAEFDAALEADLTERLGGQLDLYREYLDNGRFALTDEYQRTFRTLLRDMYHNRPDVVVAVALAPEAAVLTVLVAVAFAPRPLTSTASVADDAERRTCLARLRVAVEPVGDDLWERYERI